MTHDDARDLLPLQALGVLEGDERTALEAHLAGCAACREALAEEAARRRCARPCRAAGAAAARAEGEGARGRDRTRPGRAISRRLRTAPQPGVARYWYAPWLVAAAAAVLAVATSVGLVRARAEIDRLRGEIVAVESRLADADQRTVTGHGRGARAAGGARRAGVAGPGADHARRRAPDRQRQGPGADEPVAGHAADERPRPAAGARRTRLSAVGHRRRHAGQRRHLRRPGPTAPAVSSPR